MKLLFLCFPAIAFGHASGLHFSEEASKRGTYDKGKSFAVAMADVNNDGFVDMFVTNSESSNHLYINRGAEGLMGEYKDVTSPNLASEKRSSRGAAFADINGDGNLDLYVTDASGPNQLYIGDGINGHFSEVFDVGVADTGMGQGVCFGDVDGDGDIDIFVNNFDRSNNLYLNNGKGSFLNVTEKAGLISTGNSGFGCAFADFDDDGDLDLYVSNSGQLNKLYMNNGSGIFTDTTKEAGVGGDTGLGRGVSVGDLNGDGHLDIYVVSPKTPNFLFFGDGTGHFTDGTTSSGAGDSGFAQGVNIADIDGDGDLDIFVANILTACSLYENDGTGHFTDIATTAGVNFHLFGQGVAFGDVDNDGDLDIFVNTYASPPAGFPGMSNKLLINQGKPAPFLMVSPTDAEGHKTLVNTEVRVFEAGTRKPAAVRMQIDGGSGFASQNAYEAYFGLSTALAGGATKFDIEMRCSGHGPWITKQTRPDFADVMPGRHVLACSKTLVLV